jgi:nickel transport protein
MINFYRMSRSLLHTLGLLLFTFSLVIIMSTNASAHRMKVFAWVEGDTVGGEAYFMGGEMIANAKIELIAGQQVVAAKQSDSAGQFIFDAVTPGNYQIRADAGQGHIASFDIAQTEFATEAPAVTATTTTTNTNSTVASPAVTCVQTSVLTSAQLETAIAKAIRPLREEIDQYEAKVRMHDVLGGIGYIFGLFGFWMLLRSRRQ